MYYYNDMPFDTEQAAKTAMGSIKMYYAGTQILGYVNQLDCRYREYTFLSEDIDKLDTITNASDGSRALAVDTNRTYILCTGEWREWTGGNSGGTGSIKWDSI